MPVKNEKVGRAQKFRRHLDQMRILGWSKSPATQTIATLSELHHCGTWRYNRHSLCRLLQQDALRYRLDAIGSAPSYTPVAAGVAADLQRPQGPIDLRKLILDRVPSGKPVVVFQ